MERELLPRRSQRDGAERNSTQVRHEREQLLPPGQRDGAARESTDEHLRIERLEGDLARDQELEAINQTADALIREAREGAEAARSSGVERGAVTVAQRLLEEWRARTHTEHSDHAARLEGDRSSTDESLLRERTHFDRALAGRDEVLAVAGHELRNMVSGSLGFAAFIESEAKRKGYDELIKPAQNIVRAGVRMQRLVGDLMDAARIAAGGLELKPEPGDLTKVVTEAVDAFEDHASARDVSLTVEFIEPLPLVQLDTGRVLQVLVNLLSNALKFTPPGGRVAVRVELVGCEVRCAVTDSGPGVPAEMLEAIFERYRQVVKGDRRGLGLGLYIAKYIAQGHGGRLWARSKPGEGTTLMMTLPVAA